MKNLFTEHPETVGETYFQHLKFAGLFGFKMAIGGCACMIHAVFPFIFANTGSNFLFKLMKSFIERMPEVDDKVEEISRVIENKKSKKVSSR